MNEDECRRIEAVVMLGPPNRGSILAYFGKNKVARNINASLADMTPSPDSFVRNIPPPPFLPPVGIVAAKYDGKVALSSTLLPDGQPCERIIVPCTHPGLRNPQYTLEPILRFFRSKTFLSGIGPASNRTSVGDRTSKKGRATSMGTAGRTGREDSSMT